MSDNQLCGIEMSACMLMYSVFCLLDKNKKMLIFCAQRALLK